MLMVYYILSTFCLLEVFKTKLETDKLNQKTSNLNKLPRDAGVLRKLQFRDGFAT